MLRTFLMFMLITFTSVCFAGTEILQFKTGVEIDGKNKEWTSPLPNFDKKTGINYSVSNDLNNLYFILRITDEKTIRQITKNGLEVWINKEGKKKMTTGISYPLPVKATAVQPIAFIPTEEATKKETTLEPLIKGPLPDKNLKLTGFLLDNIEQPIIGCNVKVAASIDDSGCFIYELKVPFNTFYKEYLDQDDIATKFCIGFIIKDVEIVLTEEAMHMAMERSYGGGMRGGMGNMGGMGGMPAMPAMVQSDTPEKVFWFMAKPSLR